VARSVVYNKERGLRSLPLLHFLCHSFSRRVSLAGGFVDDVAAVKVVRMYVAGRKFNKLTFIAIFRIVVGLGRVAGVAGVAGGVAEWSGGADDVGDG